MSPLLIMMVSSNLRIVALSLLNVLLFIVATIGFETTSINVDERDGFLTLNVTVLMNRLGSDVNIHISTAPVNATGKLKCIRELIDFF